MIISLLKTIGKISITFLKVIGDVTLFTFNCFYFLSFKHLYFNKVVYQLFYIGFLSIPVIGLTCLFSGMVLAIQSFTGFSEYNAEDTVSKIVVLSITRELGPVLSGLMIAGRVGASIAAEIGTMKVTEQIDALKIMGKSPIQYLVIPRLIAGIVSMPFLVLLGNSIGILGGWIIAVTQLELNSTMYLINTIETLKFSDILQGLVKASFFGFIVTLMGCYNGLKCSNGAQGVGKASTNSVVSASILILISNYLITSIFFGNQ